jgi:hypothetical protein
MVCESQLGATSAIRSQVDGEIEAIRLIRPRVTPKNNPCDLKAELYSIAHVREYCQFLQLSPQAFLLFSLSICFDHFHDKGSSRHDTAPVYV